MVNVLEWVNGEAVVRERLVEEAPPFDADAARADAMARVLRWCDTVARGVTGRYVAAEVAAWPAKAANARQIMAGGDVPTLIAVEAAALGVTPADLAAVIVTKAEAYETIIAGLAAVRQKAAALIEVAASQEELQTILAGVRTELNM